jgi:hypothetical protein
MKTYYFDMHDGVPIRDLVGLEFRTDLQAIEHSKHIARRFDHEHPPKHDKLYIMVLNESGAEIHRESIYPTAA